MVAKMAAAAAAAVAWRRGPHGGGRGWLPLGGLLALHDDPRLEDAPEALERGEQRRVRSRERQPPDEELAWSHGERGRG